jgi:hypothetical protein
MRNVDVQRPARADSSAVHVRAGDSLQRNKKCGSWSNRCETWRSLQHRSSRWEPGRASPGAYRSTRAISMIESEPMSERWEGKAD